MARAGLVFANNEMWTQAVTVDFQLTIIFI